MKNRQEGAACRREEKGEKEEKGRDWQNCAYERKRANRKRKGATDENKGKSDNCDGTGHHGAEHDGGSGRGGGRIGG